MNKKNRALSDRTVDALKRFAIDSGLMTKKEFEKAAKNDKASKEDSRLHIHTP